MTDSERPYSSLPIEELEALFRTHPDDIIVLSQLVQELSLRKTRRSRRLLASAATTLADLDLEIDQSEEPSSSDDELPPTNGRLASSDYEDEEAAASDDAFDRIPFGPSTSTADSEQPPDDRRRPDRNSRIRPVGTNGLPSAWVRPLKSDQSLGVSTDAGIPQIYAAALRALIAEIKSTGAGQRRYDLENGIRSETTEIVYEFSFTDGADLFEDAKVEVEVSGRRLVGSIVSINSGRLWLAIGEELGRSLQRVVLLVDATALLEALKQKIEDVHKGEIRINRDIADAVIGKRNPPKAPTAIPEAHSAIELDPAKREALTKALTSPVTYVWGPPGCGKTFLLGEIVRSGFEAGKRMLVCSNTNKAVDQVLYQICRSLGAEHPAMDEGRIVRLGTIADAKLESEYRAFVTVDGIVERRSSELKARQNEIQLHIAQIDRGTVRAREILDRLAQLDGAQRTLEYHLESTNGFARTGKELASNLQSIRKKLRDLGKELERRRNATFTVFKRSEDSIQRDIAAAQAHHTKVASAFEGTRTQHSEAKARFDAAKIERDRFHVEVSKLDRSAAERIIAEADDRRAPFVAELREIESTISDLRTVVMKEANVVGATCTKTYLAAKEIGQFDIVIIDEVSMVLLPMVWFVSGLAKERVIACGDFCQIPPIVQTSQQAIHDVLGHDVFAAAGLDSHRASDSRMAMLTTQYRMHDAICNLIAMPMYGGLLTTALDRRRTQPLRKPPTPYDDTLTIVDTSDLWPFESVNAFYSRFNLMHALLARNLAWHFNRHGYIQTEQDFGICTPYAAQSKLIRKLLDGEGLGHSVQVGTVHNFQGDQRSTILLELPEGYGGSRMLGQFLQGVPPKQIGARLINVAVSRAKDHLIVLANLTYIDRLLPSASLLRGVLYDMQQKGRVISGRDLLALRPIASDLRGLFDRVPLDLDANTMGVFNQSTFDSAIEVDLANAKDSIVIFSGFVTPGRVAKLGDLLRSKTANGVKVRCVTRPPTLNGTMDPARSKNALDALERIGCTVDCRARIHEKIVLIDKEIIWHGSLNVLSHTHRTDESMTRVTNKGLAEALAANMSKRRISADTALRTIGDAENPRCEDCGARSVYSEGRFGPFFYCEEECGWKINLKNAARISGTRSKTSSDGNIPREGPACPLCSEKTLLRNGRSGPFYGCIKFPQCKGTINATPR